MYRVIFIIFLNAYLVYGQQEKTRSTFLSLFKEMVPENSPPNYDTEEPTLINCFLNIHRIDSIRESEMDFTLDLGITLSWKNPKLIKGIPYGKTEMFEHLDFDAQNMDKVWVPDIYFPNEKKASIHNIMMVNKMLRLHRDSTVTYMIRVSVTLSCRMDLRKYPFDKQVCSILLESFGYTESKLVLGWDYSDNLPIKRGDIKELRQFRLVDIEHTNFTRTHNITGNHSCLRADFHLVRNIGFYVIQMYVPSMLIVMLSWLSFWLNENSVPGRVTLGVLSVLTISTQSANVNAALPRVSYTKAIDVWMATCLVFVFAALTEFAVVNVLSQKAPGRKFSLAKLFQVKAEKEEGQEEKDTSVDQDGRVAIADKNQPKRRAVTCSNSLDMASRLMFPFAFGVFNMIYWIYYLNVTEY